MLLNLSDGKFAIRTEDNRSVSSGIKPNT